ncbi:MAG: hypothetical protein IVW54_14480 [Candidatus Binataceae bacterium]|nr:hypothetical protein [Candidatus Binataceae bacterium]
MVEDSGAFSAEVMSFVRAYLRSVWSLELLLLMRQKSDRIWAIDELTQELRASDLIVGRIIQDFQQFGLVIESSPGKFRYSAANSALHELVDQIAKLYAVRPVAMIDAIVNSPKHRIQSFADAFKFKRR